VSSFLACNRVRRAELLAHAVAEVSPSRGPSGGSVASEAASALSGYTARATIKSLVIVTPFLRQQVDPANLRQNLGTKPRRPIRRGFASRKVVQN
jgi:hypothetical protein